MIRDHIKGRLTLGGQRIASLAPIGNPVHAAQQAHRRAAERAGKRVAVQFAKPEKPWAKR